jgi:hypothetical protein
VEGSGRRERNDLDEWEKDSKLLDMKPSPERNSALYRGASMPNKE